MKRLSKTLEKVVAPHMTGSDQYPHVARLVDSGHGRDAGRCVRWKNAGMGTPVASDAMG
jgi:hypothetical protein